jgi:hypothetical protein
MLQNIRLRTVSPFIRMIVRLLQYGQERLKPKRKGSLWLRPLRRAEPVIRSFLSRQVPITD